MPFNIIKEHLSVDPDTDAYWVPSFRNFDLGWLSRRGSTKVAALCRVGEPGNIEAYAYRPAIFTSSDGGTIWTLQDEAGSPAGTGNLGPAFDCAYAGSGNLACFLDTNASASFVAGHFYHSYFCSVAIFDFDTLTWGAPFASFDIINSFSPLSRALFSKRPDGSYVLIVNNDSGVQAWILTGGGWAGPSTLVGSGTATRLVIGADNLAHVLVGSDAYLLDTDGSVLSSSATGFVAPVGPLRIKSSALTVPALVSFTDLVIERGTPPNVPVWTEEAVSSPGFIYEAVLVTEASSVDVGFEWDAVADSSHDIKTGMFSLAGSSGTLAMYWISSDTHSILRSRKVSGVWSSPDTVFSDATGYLLNLGVTDIGGGGPMARYYAE